MSETEDIAPRFLRPDIADVFLGYVASGRRDTDLWTLKGESGVVCVFDNLSPVQSWTRSMLQAEIARRPAEETSDFRNALRLLNLHERREIEKADRVLVLTNGAVDIVRTPRALKAYVEARDTEADLLLRLRTGALDQVADLAGMFLAASQATDRAARALAEEAVEAFGKAGAELKRACEAGGAS